MQRDMELIRTIFSEVKAKTDLHRRPLKIEGYDDLAVNRHIEMLINNGYLEGTAAEIINRGTVECSVKDLTMSGHDFAAALESDGVWARLKESWTAAELANVPLSIVKDVGVALLKKLLMQKVGLFDPPGT